MTQLQQELPLFDVSMSPWEIASIVLAICGGIIFLGIGVYCCYMEKFKKRLMMRNNKRVRFAGNDQTISHSRAVAVLGGGRDYQHCNVGTTSSREHGYDGDYMELQVNEAYEVVDLHNVDETTLDVVTENISERDRTKQKKPSISPLHDLQEGKGMSVDCVVRDSRRRTVMEA